MFLTTLTSWSVPTDLMLFYWLYKSVEGWSPDWQMIPVGTLAVWIFVSKFLKHLGHFIRYPSDVIYLPLLVLFGYVHCFIKLYALWTLDVVSTWTGVYSSHPIHPLHAKLKQMRLRRCLLQVLC